VTVAAPLAGERGASLNRQGKQWAALHHGIGGHTEVVAYLLERGVISTPCRPTVRRR
jgi:hypothetical protein